jgi:hypothetical protein
MLFLASGFFIFRDTGRLLTWLAEDKMQFSFDPIQFLTSGAQLAPAIIFIVIAFTYFAGTFGLAGKGQLAFALILGLLLGGGAQLARFAPATFADYFSILVYALVMAATPPLLYDQAKELLKKIIAAALGITPQGEG